MFTVGILSISILLQFAAAFLTLRLIRITGRNSAWLFLSGAFILMMFRRLIPFYHFLSDGELYGHELAAESVSLFISLLVVIGLLRIRSMFYEMKETKEWRFEGKLPLFIASMFVLLCVFVWLDEILDLPHVLTGAPMTPVNWQESIIETIFIILLALYVLSKTVYFIRQNKRVEEALRHSEERLISYIRIIRQLGWTANPNGEIVENNPLWEDYTGQNFDKMKGWGWIAALHPKDRKQTSGNWRKAVKTKTSHETEFRIRSQNGQYRWFLSRAVPMFREDGSMYEWIVACIDIHERKRIENEINKLNAELTAKNKEMEQILYATSHDLRSPLVNIQGFSKELQASLGTLKNHLLSDEDLAVVRRKCNSIMDEDLAESLGFILSSTSRMDKLLTGLLILSRLGRQKFSPLELDMNEIMANVLSNSKYEINEKHVILNISNLPPCWGDELQINQAFSNLVGNALKFLDPDRPGIITITGEKTGDLVYYSVKDNGIGIAANHQKKVFDLFHKLDPQKPGMGLGLNIVKQIIEKHGGKIEIQSYLGVGTLFKISLPSVEKDNKKDELK